ncbi:MAG: uracil-DNA glycosylase [Lentisphaeria bacterium]|nr:uracil-DNA glycosylase [Lentisphaeria bacterium]
MPDSPAWREFLQNAPAPGGNGQQTAPAASPVSPVPSVPVPSPAAVAGGDLEALRQQALACRGCPLCEQRTNVVFGEGDPHAQLMFIGEGPGFDEDRLGRPFVGKAGQLLDKMITAMQFTRGSVYICNIVKCRPPGNRVPMPEEAEACLPYLKAQISLVSPQAIVLLGATAAHYLLGRQEGITRLRGRWLDYNGIPVMPTYHPAFLLRKPEAKRDAWSDLQQVMAKFNKFHRPRPAAAPHQV